MGAIFLTTKNFVKVIKLDYNCELKDEKRANYCKHRYSVS